MRKLMGKLGTGLIAGLALMAAPVAAQDEPADETAMMEAMAAAFVFEPLTAEQQARLPLARTVIDRMMPPGTLQEVMGGMFGGMLNPIMAMEADDPASVVSARFGYDITANAEEAAEVAAILDPVWAERRRREAEAVPLVIGRMMGAMEPIMRDVMSELYAAHFTDPELTGIDAFFATPIGAAYARKSFSMTSDPRLMGRVMQELPTILGSMGDMEAEVAAITADLPPERGYDDLSEAERERLAGLLGTSVDDLQWRFDSEAYEAGAEAAAGAAADAAAGYDDYTEGPTQPASGSTPVSKP